MSAKIVSIPGLKAKNPLGWQFTTEHEPSIYPNLLQPETYTETHVSTQNLPKPYVSHLDFCPFEAQWHLLL